MSGPSGSSSRQGSGINSNAYHDNRNKKERTEIVTMKIALFGVMGEYGNNIMVYDTESIMLKHQI
jgi:hypothetical protein